MLMPQLAAAAAIQRSEALVDWRQMLVDEVQRQLSSVPGSSWTS